MSDYIKNEKMSDLPSRIFGWGADLNPANRPGVPKEKFSPSSTGAHWDVPEQQRSNVKIFKSIERPNVTPVFGTTCPPKGLSGFLRERAYQKAEGKISHWVILLLADRIDVIESILSDVIRGKAGNPFYETGVQVELKERAPSFVVRRRVTLGLAMLAGILGLAVSKSTQNKRYARAA